MMQITCPHCGPRAQSEFIFERTVDSVVTLDAAPEAAMETLFTRSNPRALDDEIWRHTYGWPRMDDHHAPPLDQRYQRRSRGRARGFAMITFSFDGRNYQAQPGDTLAAALLRNEIGLVGRSFKYHRPRGIMTAGVEEPNALVTVGEGGRAEPNTRATDVFIYEGMVATSQNRWPSLNFDVAAIFGLAAPMLSAGFYYKTFFGSAKRWMFYEYFIRKAAGLGNAPTLPDPDRFSQRAAFCDVLVVGAGPAGLQAARDAAEAGKRVILVEQDNILGASLIRDPQAQDAMWIEATAARIRELGGHILMRTTASGYWEHDLVTLTQRLAEPGQVPANGVTQRLWHVRARQGRAGNGQY